MWTTYRSTRMDSSYCQGKREDRKEDMRCREAGGRACSVGFVSEAIVGVRLPRYHLPFMIVTMAVPVSHRLSFYGGRTIEPDIFLGGYFPMFLRIVRRAMTCLLLVPLLDISILDSRGKGGRPGVKAITSQSVTEVLSDTLRHTCHVRSGTVRVTRPAEGLHMAREPRGRDAWFRCQTCRQ